MVRCFVVLWKNVEEDRNKLQAASQHHKDVEHGVKPLLFRPDAVKHRPQGVGDPPGQGPQKARHSEYCAYRLYDPHA